MNPTRTRALSALFAVVTTALCLPAQERLRRGSADDQLVDAEVTAAVDRGLAYLQQTQARDGSWEQLVGYKLNSDYETVDSRPLPHVGVTALCGIAFLAGGHLPDRGKYGETITRALDHVLSCSQDNGQIAENGTRMYSHAFATLFLAEIYGMSNNPRVKQVLQRSVNLIVDSQNAEGGWRYQAFARESDMSITVCQVLALRSARNVGIAVPVSNIRNAQNYVYRSAVRSNERAGRRRGFGGYGDDGGSFRYQLKPQTRATFPLTAAGVTTLYASGEYDSPIIKDALDYLDRELFSFNDQNSHGHYFFYYGHYYAVQAYYITGGSQWRRYFTEVKGRLLSMQRPDGSWPNDVGPGPAFGTAVASLILQIPLQYLPIFQR